MRRTLVIASSLSVALFAVALFAVACSGKQPAPSAPCDQACRDAIALRALREGMRSAFNINVYDQEKDNGPQDVEGRCSDTGVGSAHIVGTAVSNREQGITKVNLTYEFLSCLVARTEAQPDLNYRLSLKGTVTEVGTLSAQSTSLNALKIATLGGSAADGGADGGDDGGADGGVFSTVSFTGTVYDPPVEYHETSCEILTIQNGNNVSGWICGRIAGYGQ